MCFRTIRLVAAELVSKAVSLSLNLGSLLYQIPRAKLSCTWNTIYSPANKNWSLTHSFAVALEKLRSMALPLTKAGISESRIDDTDWDDAYGEDESIEEVEGEKEKSGGNEEEDDNDSRDHGSSSGTTTLYLISLFPHAVELILN